MNQRIFDEKLNSLLAKNQEIPVIRKYNLRNYLNQEMQIFFPYPLYHITHKSIVLNCSGGKLTGTPGGVHNMLGVQVCAAHIGGLLG